MERVVIFDSATAVRGLGALKIFPLRAGETTLGTLVCGTRRRDGLPDAAQAELGMLALQAAAAIARTTLYEQAERLATTDGLTGLMSRRALAAQLTARVREAQRYRRPLSLLLVDVDHFKKVNDTHGHPAGDAVLRGVAAVARAQARETDVVARYGGEEMALVLPETDAAGARAIAERLREAVEPTALYKFKDNNVIIPIYVVEEIDKFKRDLSELGRNARQVSRDLDAFRAEGGSLSEGVPLDGGGSLRVLFTQKELPRELMNGHLADNRILALAADIKDREPNLRCVFVSKDVNLRIRADALGLPSEDYRNDKIENPEVYMGVREVEASRAEIDSFYAQGELTVPEAIAGTVCPNEFALLKDRDAASHTPLAKYNAAKGKFVPLMKSLKEGAWGLRPRNKEQSFALDLLLNEEIKLVTIVGKAGTGKTLLAIAAGLQKTMEEQVYQKMLVSRPVFPLGKDIGYLPGSVEEKLNPWMQPIYDNVEFLMGLSRADKKAGRSYKELVDLGLVAIEPLTYIRGRSIPNQYIVVDEAQNLTPHEVKTIITRVGDNTKIVLTGDPYQIDNPYVDSTSNGLVHVVNKFKHERLAGHITLTKGERSALAELASNVL